MNKRRFTSTLIILVLLLVLSVGGFWYHKIHSWPDDHSCSTLSQAEILNLLPAGANQYDLSNGAYSPDFCYYAVDALIGATIPSDANNPSNPITGIWVIDIKADTAYRLSAPDPKAGGQYFDKWISNTQFEMMGSSNEIVTTYDAVQQQIINRQVVNVLFRFIKLSQDVTIIPQAVSGRTIDASCLTPQKTIQYFFTYPISCLQQSSIMLNVPGYTGGVKLQYVDPLTIIVNSTTKQLSTTQYVEIDW